MILFYLYPTSSGSHHHPHDDQTLYPATCILTVAAVDQLVTMAIQVMCAPMDRKKQSLASTQSPACAPALQQTCLNAKTLPSHTTHNWGDCIYNPALTKYNEAKFQIFIQCKVTIASSATTSPTTTGSPTAPGTWGSKKPSHDQQTNPCATWGSQKLPQDQHVNTGKAHEYSTSNKDGADEQLMPLSLLITKWKFSLPNPQHPLIERPSESLHMMHWVLKPLMHL